MTTAVTITIACLPVLGALLAAALPGFSPGDGRKQTTSRQQIAVFFRSPLPVLSSKMGVACGNTADAVYIYIYCVYVYVYIYI